MVYENFMVMSFGVLPIVFQEIRKIYLYIVYIDIFQFLFQVHTKCLRKYQL